MVKKSLGIERRFFCTELRAESQGDETAIVGYAAKFNTVSHDLGGFREKIAPGAFTRTLRENADVRCLMNHNPSLIMGRTKSGTLTLSEDNVGLRFRSVLPDTQAARDLHTLVKRGDIDECSFGFTVAANGQNWTEEKSRDNSDWYAMRTLTDVDLLDVSAVTYPAYPNTQVGARAMFPDVDVEKELHAKVAEMRSAYEKREEDSIEDMLRLINKALATAFPADASDAPSCCTYDGGQYWILETYVDYVIASECKTGKYFKIPYTKDGDAFSFGGPQPVEQTWVPAERATKRLAEMRNRLQELAEHYSKGVDENAKINAEAHAADNAEIEQQRKAAAAIKAKGDQQQRCTESMGSCDEGDCECQNNMADLNDVFDDDDDSDEDRTARRAVEHRDANGKVRTKKVGGKNLTKDKFAYVGDPTKTETWKLPIHDAGHVRNALARFNQTEGIPADKKAGVYRKIKAAAEKFDIQVSDEDNSRALASFPGDDLERIEWQLKFEAIRN
jgi:hypothetical protein